MADNVQVSLPLNGKIFDEYPELRDAFLELERMILNQSSNNDTKTTNISTNETSVETNATNVATNVADIATNTSDLSTHIADITTVHGRPNCKYDATSAPGVTNDIDEGYTTGSTWTDETNDKSYVCLDNTDGAAVWTETTQSGGAGTSFDTDFYGTMSADTTLTTGTWGKAAFDTATRDNNFEFNATTDEWVCKTAGTYVIIPVLSFDANSTGQRSVGISLNGSWTPVTADYMMQKRAVGSGKTRVDCPTVMALSVNDTLEIYGYQNSGGNLNVDKDSSRFWVYRIQ